MILCRNSSKPLRLYKSADKREQNEAMEQREQSQTCLSYAESRLSSRNSTYFDYAEREQTRSEVRVKPCRELKILCPDNVKTSPQNYENRTQIASKTTTIFTLFSHKKWSRTIAVGTTDSYTPSMKLLR